MTTFKEARIELTDRPGPKDGRCPQCGASKDKRERTGSFGPIQPVHCTQCGRLVPEEER